MLQAAITVLAPNEEAGPSPGTAPAAFESTGAWAIGLIEHLAIGVVLLDRGQRARYVNRAAMAMLRGRGPLWLDEAGTLRLRSSRLARQFARLLADPAGAETDEARILALGRIDGDPAPTIVMRRSDHAGAITLLLLDRRAMVGAEALARLYALTPTEAAVLNQLVLGRSVHEIASRHGVCVSTVRSQLKTLLGKTGTRRQAALVGKVLADSCALLVLPRGPEMIGRLAGRRAPKPCQTRPQPA